MIFFLFSEIFISQLDRLQFESKYKMNRQGWKDALYVDKSILNTTQQTRLGEGSKNRDFWDWTDSCHISFLSSLSVFH